MKREPVSTHVVNVNISVKRELIRIKVKKRIQKVHSAQHVISYYTFFISGLLEPKPDDDEPSAKRGIILF